MACARIGMPSVEEKMTPIETLRKEHEVIRTALKAARREAERIADEGEFDSEKMLVMIEFFRDFTDRNHHAKEEEALFPLVREHIPGRGILLEKLLADHDESRHYRRQMAAAFLSAEKGEELAIPKAMDYLRTFIDHLQAHIDLEDRELIPLAEQFLGDESRQALAEAFHRIETATTGARTLERYSNLAARLAGDRDR
jgi:hemerythrin-like domain-containing protein